MFKKILHGAALGTLLLFGASACTSSASNTVSVESGGEAAKTDAAANNSAAETAKSKTASELKGGAPVPAKRANLTVADREKFLAAIGHTEAAENSAFFVENFEKGLGKKVENAAMNFHALGSGKYLVEIIVGQGARITTSMYALYHETGAGKATAKALRLDEYSVENGKTIKKTVGELLGLPYFDEKTKTLEIVASGRGGCGSYTKYKFTNDRAETVEARHSECTDDYDTPPEKWEKLTLIADGANSDDVNNDSNGDDAGKFEHIKSEHAAVLKKYLKTKPDLYPAVEADYDRANPKLVEIRKENQRNHPYYVADDFNGDGQEDFAVILKSKTAKNTFRSAVFNGPLDRNNGTPAFSGASDYRFVFQLGDSPDMPPLYIGSYASDDGFILEASGKGYKVVSMLD